MGMGTYGRSFTLADEAETGLNAAATGAGTAGRNTNEPGFLSYYEICDFVKNKGWTSEFIDEIKSPIAYKGEYADCLQRRVRRSLAKASTKKRAGAAF